MTPKAARRELLRCAGTQFDEQVVEAFLAVLDSDAGTRQSEALADGEGS
jgi:HD-GYP domain-containing protein (c-di-GMP phosphodiesterase class II)